jgi:hypothetical protein
MGTISKWNYFLELPNGSPKIGTFIVPKLWVFISSSKQMRLEHVRAIFYIPQNDISNGVLHALIRTHLTLALKGFVVKSQILNLIPNHSFDHSSCI